MNTLDSIIAANMLAAIRKATLPAWGMPRNLGAKGMVQYMLPISKKNEVIVVYQLLHRISLANGFVANISSFPVSMCKFKQHSEIIIVKGTDKC